MNTRVHDFASDSRALHQPGSFPHPNEGTGNTFMVGKVGFFGKEGADPLLVGDQRNPRSSLDCEYCFPLFSLAGSISAK